MTKYAGSITTTGSSQAILLEKAFFRAHPEFEQKAKVRAAVIGRGQMLVSLVDEGEQADEADPILTAFLGFLERDMEQSPKRIEPLSSGLIGTAAELVHGVNVSDEDSIPDDITI